MFDRLLCLLRMKHIWVLFGKNTKEYRVCKYCGRVDEKVVKSQYTWKKVNERTRKSLLSK